MDVDELKRQVEYKFAPVPLIAVQALANTFAFETEEERLLDPDAARRWMVESELAADSVRVDRGEWEKLREFRSAVRDLIDAAKPATAFAAIAVQHPPPVAVADGGTVGIDLEPVGSVDELIAQFVGIILRAQLEGNWERLKICASDECRWSFYDSSRNRGGTWCSMETCGNVINNRSYRRRRASGARA
jgi:predicted RNA-binding Zn ribbon-like protein